MTHTAQHQTFATEDWSERRQDRSTYWFRAVELYFDAIIARGGPDAVCLFDDVGVVAGSAPLGCDLDDLAHTGAALLDAGRTSSSAHALFARGIVVSGEPYGIVTQGAPIADIDRLLADLERIALTTS